MVAEGSILRLEKDWRKMKAFLLLLLYIFCLKKIIVHIDRASYSSMKTFLQKSGSYHMIPFLRQWMFQALPVLDSFFSQFMFLTVFPTNCLLFLSKLC